MMLKEKCSMTDSEWEERQKTRQLEMEACSKALAVLSSADAHDLFTKTFNPSLLQKQNSMHSERRLQASKLLSGVARKMNNPRLATLAVRVRLDAFTRVIRSEEDAQKAYEDFVKDTNGSIEAKSKDIVNKSESKAKAEADLVETKENKEAVMLELEQLANYKAELHQSCDFVVKNFEIRQTARDEEVEALRQAKAILSGAKFEAFLQGA